MGDGGSQWLRHASKLLSGQVTVHAFFDTASTRAAHRRSTFTSMSQQQVPLFHCFLHDSNIAMLKPQCD